MTASTSSHRLDTLEKIARQADIVRTAQKTYFRTRSAGDLEYSKAQERELDHLLIELKHPIAGNDQGELLPQ